MHGVYKGKNSVYHFNLFEKRRKTTEMPLRAGFELHSYKASANLNIPFIIRFAVYSRTPENKAIKNPYGIEHISDVRIRRFFRAGFDAYKGEFAILLPLFRLWLQCDYFGNNFWQFRRFSILIFLLKIKWNELTFRAGIAGVRISLRLGPE